MAYHSKRIRVLLWAVFFLLASCEHSFHHNEPVVSYHIPLGMGYLKQHDMPRAKRHLLIALDEMPTSPDAYGAMAYYLEKTGNMEAARRYYEKALSLNPHYGPALNNYGAFLCRQALYEMADRYFRKAVIEPRYEHPAEAYENAGLCATLEGNTQRARDYFLKALKEDPLRQSTLKALMVLERDQGNTQQVQVYVKRLSNLTKDQ